MNRYETDFYGKDVPAIRKALERIANALEEKNKLGKLVYKDDGTVDFKPKDIPGFEGTLDALDNLYQPTSNNPNPAGYANEASFALAKAVDEACNKDEYETDGTSVGNGKYEDEELYLNTNQGSVNQDDPYTYEPNPNRDKGEPALIEYCDGIKNDSDHDIRSTAKMYFDLMISTDLGNPDAYKFRTKKDCILDYVTNEFGSHGARYTDVIKFAYYLGAPNAPKYDATRDRGYYSCAFSSRMNGHLIQGGKDQLVKGINKEGKERYFALSFVESATAYWKRIG